MRWTARAARWSLRLSPLAVACSVLVVAQGWAGFAHPDVLIQQEAVRVLLSRRWAETYLVVPKAQMGPLAIVLVVLPRHLYVAVISSLVLPFLVLSRPSTGSWMRRGLWSAASVGLVVPWSQFAWKGHADDALVLCCAAAGIWAYERRRPRIAAVAFVVGLAAKPTAVLLAPLLSGETAATGLAAAALVWAPFALSDPAQFLRAGRGVMHIAPQSMWARIGVTTGPPPSWLRPSQLVLGLGASLWLRARRCVSVAILAAFTVRSLTEMAPAPAYAASVVALALVADARESGTLPMFTVLGLVAFWTSQPALDGASGWPRIIAHGAVLAWALTASVRRGTPIARSEPQRSRDPEPVVPFDCDRDRGMHRVPR